MSKTSDTVEPQPRYSIERVNTLELELDPRNPRLSLVEEGSSQPELLAIVLQRFKVEELAESILASGFNSFDPIVGWRDDGTITIIEGNRRVAALKCLLRPELAPERLRPRWRELSERMTPDVARTIRELEVRVYRDRDDPELLAYVGFRHVTGVLTWPSLEKAKYIARLIEEEGWKYARAADRLGSYPRHVERHYVAYRLVRQADAAEIEGSLNIQSSFGVLLRALQVPGVIQFLGLSFPGDPEASREPIADERMEEFRDFVLWTFGTEERTKLLPDSRRLTEWGRILESPRAVSYLRRSGNPDFGRAFFFSGAEAESLADGLFSAADQLEEAVPRVSEHVSDSAVQDAVRECFRFLSQILTHFETIAHEFGWHPNDRSPPDR